MTGLCASSAFVCFCAFFFVFFLFLLVLGALGQGCKIAVCFLWLSLPGDCRVTDEALLTETT